jgi:hypothetical protein
MARGWVPYGRGAGSQTRGRWRESVGRECLPHVVVFPWLGGMSRLRVLVAYPGAGLYLCSTSYCTSRVELCAVSISVPVSSF